jgi:uncharacterized protein (DUF2235 family)
MLRKCWLPEAAGEDLVEEGFRIYRIREGGADGPEALTFRAQNNCRKVQIHLIGVWDTVGALGIPLSIARQLDEQFNGFHDTKLSSYVDFAYHAVAIDEHRVDYDVTLWDDLAEPRPNQTVEQRWFVGAHANVGGGYPDQQLANITLAWMIAKVRQAGSDGFPNGLRVADADGPDAATPASSQGVLRDSYKEFLGVVYRLLHLPYYREITLGPQSNETIDPSVASRVDSSPPGQPSYRPRNLLTLGNLWRQYLGK